MKSRSRLWRTVALAAALAAPLASAAGQGPWGGTLQGTNEVPPNASPATGWAYLFASGNFLNVQVFWQGLVGGNPAAAHIHCCTTPGTNIGVAVGFPSFPATASGYYTRQFDLSDPSVYTANFLNNFGGGTAAGAQAALFNGLSAGRAYVNIHNAQFPGGEIRANVVATPEPASLALVATGLGMFALVARRRRTAA